MALAHKGFFPEGIPVGFTEKSLIAFSGQERVPILVDQGTIVTESWTIACHLEDSYPDRPTLFGGSMGRNLASFIDAWATRSVFPLLVRLVLCDVVDHLEEADANYVRASREKQMGVTFDAMRQERCRHRRQATDMNHAAAFLLQVMRCRDYGVELHQQA